MIKLYLSRDLNFKCGFRADTSRYAFDDPLDDGEGYFCTSEDLQHIFNAGMAYMAGKGMTLDEYLKLQGVEDE